MLWMRMKKMMLAQRDVTTLPELQSKLLVLFAKSIKYFIFELFSEVLTVEC